VEVTRYNVHEIMVEVYPLHTDPRSACLSHSQPLPHLTLLFDFRIQQQIVWLLDVLVSYPRTLTRLHISSTCMSWIGKLIETREELIATVGTSVKDKYLPYKIVIPLRVRQFYRDTGGRVLEVAPENEVRITYSLREHFLMCLNLV
jgi:hypothetical protein